MERLKGGSLSGGMSTATRSLSRISVVAIRFSERTGERSVELYRTIASVCNQTEFAVMRYIMGFVRGN
jgi:hypothetical protein